MSEIKSLTLGDKKYDSFPDAESRERLSQVEYLPVATEQAQEHNYLPEGEKTVTISGDSSFGDTVYAVGSPDLLPRKTFNRTFPYNGITITKDGLNYHISGTATAAGSTYFGESSSDFNIEIPEEYIGKTFRLIAFSKGTVSNKLTLLLRFYDINNAQLSTVNMYGNSATQVFAVLTNSVSSATATALVPENVSYMRLSVETFADTEYDLDFQAFVVVDNETQTATLADGTAEISGITATDVISMPYSSTVEVDAPLKSYIDYTANNAKGDTATYLTPEAFGAIGDGYTDDIEAITLCIAKAAETKQTVLMAQKYLVSAPVEIIYSGMQIIVNDIVYTGTDCAVLIDGQQNSIKIHSVTSSGIGVRFAASGTKNTIRNDLEINSIISSSHGITFESSPVNLYQNTIRFNYIKAGGDGCYGIAYFVTGENFITENNFYGGQIANCDWAVYCAQGNSRYYGIQVEEYVKGGFYITGPVTISNPRWAESGRDGEYPFLKFANDEDAGVYINIENNTALAINEIDLSENSDVFAVGGSDLTYAVHEHRISVLNFPITCKNFEVGKDTSTPTIYSMRAYVWGKFLIMTPHMAYRKAVTAETLDTRLAGQETSESEVKALSQLPTKFVVDNINTEIYLHASYCAFGFNEFEVEQANGFTCKIYDVLGNLIFDGTEQGDGLYKFNVYKDATYCETNTGGLLRRDFLGHYWQVLKLGATII